MQLRPFGRDYTGPFLTRLLKQSPLMFQLKRIFLLAIVSCFAMTKSSSAQDEFDTSTFSGLRLDRATTPQTGQSFDEIRRLYGEPDQKKQSGEGEVETWYYGRSIIVFSKGVVSGWSDQNELSERAEIHEFEPSTNDGTVDFPEWENLWTPQKRPDPVDLLDGVIPDSQPTNP